VAPELVHENSRQVVDFAVLILAPDGFDNAMPLTASLHLEHLFGPRLGGRHTISPRLNASRARPNCLLTQHFSVSRRFSRYKTTITNVRPSITPGNLSNSQLAPAQTRHEHRANPHS
jgi:hypothetical protein